MHPLVRLGLLAILLAASPGGANAPPASAAPSPAAAPGGNRHAAPPGAAQELDFEVYRTRVEPIFLRPREAFGPGAACFLCHTKVTSRFRLEPLAAGASQWSEAASRRNFERVARLVVPGEPLKSPLLLHPLAVAAGGDPVHAGGKPWATPSDPEWQTIAAWIEAAAPGTAPATSAPAAPALDFATFRTRIEPILLAKRPGLARCYTCHSQGTTFRLQRLQPGQTTWEEAQSRLNFQAVLRVVVPGDPSASRLLMVPLAAEAGGDPFHPGGKHWRSQTDPEWQTLAAWVRGAQR
jgi:hypothetical protein